MRTKVEKRKVRHEPASNASGPALLPLLPERVREDGILNSSVIPSLSGLGTDAERHNLAPRDMGEKRFVSLDEAERLAAANHVVVALGPPVVVGASSMIVNARVDYAVGGRCNSSGVNIAGNFHRPPEPIPMIVSAAEPRITGVENKVDDVPPPIKKPPKKRRNNEKKIDMAEDLSIAAAAAALPLALLPSSNCNEEGSLDLSIRSYISSVQIPHSSSVALLPPLPSSHKLQQHNIALSSQPVECTPLYKSPLCLVSQSQLHSSTSPSTLSVPHLPPAREPVFSRGREDIGDFCEAEDLSVQQVSLSTPVAAPALVRPFEDISLSANTLSNSHETLLAERQVYADNSEINMVERQLYPNDSDVVEMAASTSTSMLQPPTWLLTPQDNAAGFNMALDTGQTEGLDLSVPHSAPDLHSLSVPEVSGKTKLNLKNNVLKSTNISDKKSDDKKVDEKITGAKTKGSTDHKNSSSENKMCLESKGDVENSRVKPKAKKQVKKSGSVSLDEISAQTTQRLASMEYTINCVIARFVYNCDDVSKLDSLRKAQREADAKEADADNVLVKKKSKKASGNKAKHSPQAVIVDSSEVSTVSNSDINENLAVSNVKEMHISDDIVKAALEVEIEPKRVVDAATMKEDHPESKTACAKQASRKKIYAKKKNKCVNGTVTQQSETDPLLQNEEAVKTPKKKSRKKKGDENSENGLQELKKDEQKPDKAVQPKTAKKSYKKKAVTNIDNQIELQPPSETIPNGHLESREDKLLIPKKSRPKSKKKKDKPDEVGVETERHILHLDQKDLGSQASCNLGSGNSEAAQCNTLAKKTEASAEEQQNQVSGDKPPVKSKPKRAKKRKPDLAEETKETENVADGQAGKLNCSKPKKAKKRKSDLVEESKATENVADGQTENKPGELGCIKPPAKKKRKKDDAENSNKEGKKKKPKAKKAKTLVGDVSDSVVSDTLKMQENGLPNSLNFAATPSNESYDLETNHDDDAKLATDEEGEKSVKSSAEKRPKKTLDEVTCADCGHKTRGQAALSRHMKKMHEKSVVLPYPCKQPACEYSASKLGLLARHMLTHSLYMCSRCQFLTDAKESYHEHLQVEHNVKLDSKLCRKCNRYVKCDTVPMEQHLELCQGPVPFACSVCSKQFKYESSLKVHHQSHFPDQPKLFHCVQCHYQSNYRANLHKHVQNMHVKREKDIKCLQCDKMFSTEDNMKRHMKVHSQVRPFKCDKCDKSFKSSCALRGHVLSHELARPYQCNIDNCNREFRTPKFLKSHQEEFHRLVPKKYHCPVEGCKFSFFKLSHLKRHEISHTGERNFHCSWPGCGKSFRHSDNLKVHLRQHTDERPVSCTMCAFTCRQKSSLHWHLKKIHGQSGSISGSENNSMDASSPSSAIAPSALDLATAPAGAEVMLESVNVIIPAGENGELPVTITELRPVDLYEFHSDNDSEDEAIPGVFKRNRTKMAAAAPLPPPPKELLLQNSVLDVLDTENNKVDVSDMSKNKKKKPSNKKSNKPPKGKPSQKKDEATKKKEEGAEQVKQNINKEETVDKMQQKTKKKSGANKRKANAKENNEKEENDNNPQTETCTPPSKKKKIAVTKKVTRKQSPKRAVEEEKPSPKGKAVKEKNSPKLKNSPKKPSSPKGRTAPAVTRKTPPRKAAVNKEKAVKTLAKKPGKKTPPKKKTASKKKLTPKKKTAKKEKSKTDEKDHVDKKESEDKEAKKGTKVAKVIKKTSSRRSKDTAVVQEEEPTSPVRAESPIESEEENMPQGKGSPYREYDACDMDESSPEPQASPSPPASPVPSEILQNSPAIDDNPIAGDEEEPIPLPAELQAELDQREAESSDGEIINDIPLTPPRAPAPPPLESSDEEEMVPSPPPPTQMPMSADNSDQAPASVITDTQQPGSQSTDFPQSHSREDFPQPLSREDFQQPHSREEFSQPMSQQPHSREDYQQQHSREEILQPPSREEYHQPHSREEYHQPHSREEYHQPHSREEYHQPLSREEYQQPLSREDLHQQHSREDLQPQGSVSEPMSEPVPSAHSEGMRDDGSMPRSVLHYDPGSVSPVPVSEAESAYQYLQGLAGSGDAISESLAGEPSRLQQLEALAEKPHEDSRVASDMSIKSPVSAVATSVITSLSPVTPSSLSLGPADMSSHRRMEILSTDRQMDHYSRDTPSALPRLPDSAYSAYSALNPLTASAGRDNGNLFPTAPATPSFMRLTESEALLQRQQMTTPFLPTPQPPERSLSRLPESSLRAPNPSALLRRPATMTGTEMFASTPGMPQTMPRNPFTNTWATQDVRPPHWGQTSPYLQRTTNAPTTPFPFTTKDNYLTGREFMFDPSVRTGMTERNMFASLSSTQSQRDLATDPNPFPLDRFDISTYFGSHAYPATTGLDYSRTACGTTPKTFDERYRQTAASMGEFRPLPPTTSGDMFSSIGVNSLNSAGFTLDKYAMYGRDSMYHAAAQQLSDNANSAFLTHAAPSQHSVFDRDYAHRSLYPHQNPTYPFIDERQYPSAAKLTGHAPVSMGQDRDFMARPTANDNQMQDPYRCGMLYNVMNRYSFE